MGYLIELSFSLKNVQNHRDLITEILDKAEKNNCDFYFKDFEFSVYFDLAIDSSLFTFKSSLSKL